MKVDKAIRLLESRIKLNREMRSNINPTSDYEVFVEENNIAIETLISEIKASQSIFSSNNDIYEVDYLLLD